MTLAREKNVRRKKLEMLKIVKRVVKWMPQSRWKIVSS